MHIGEDSKTEREKKKEIEKLYSYAGTTKKKEYDERKRSREGER